MNDVSLSREDTYPAKGDSGASAAPFRSLVERSLSAWNLLDYVGVDEPKADAVRRNTKRLRSLSSIDPLLEKGQFWFFQLKESFIQQQILMKWSPVRLDEYVLLPIDYGFVNCQDCFFVSHYWHTPEHPDPEGHDMRLFLKDLVHQEWSYIWVDWTCVPQAPRSEVQQKYFKKVLQTIPMLVRDCGFAWRFPTFEPRAWILFEVAEFMLNHTMYTVTPDIHIFVSHVEEMLKEGVRPVVSKHGYVCTNGSDLPLVIGWLELLVILTKVVPNAGTRQQIMDMLDRSYVGSYCHLILGIEINKASGILSCNGTTYRFTPVYGPNRGALTYRSRFDNLCKYCLGWIGSVVI